MFVSPVPVLVPTRLFADSAISILSCTVCLPMCCWWHSYVFRTLAVCAQVYQNTSWRPHYRWAGSSTVHVVLYALNRATTRNVPQSMQTACPYYVQHFDICDRRFGSEAGANAVVASCLLMKCGPVMTVSVIQYYCVVRWETPRLWKGT